MKRNLEGLPEEKDAKKSKPSNITQFLLYTKNGDISGQESARSSGNFR
ncbi:MAG: hypothetical protein V4612_06615 [Pseudomonadota bacterium]